MLIPNHDENAVLAHQTLSEPSSPFVCVEVNGRELQLPEHALHAGLSHLRLTTRGHAGMQDYAEAVALVLQALETQEILAFR